MRHLRVALAAVAVLGCAIEEGTKYGNPSGLKRDNLPSPPDAGTPAVDAGACATEAGACPVSWMNDIWPKMSGTGTWKCAAASCHGGGSTSPPINDPNQAYDALTAYMVGGKPYIKPCSMDPQASSFLCNLQGMCGNKMPLVDSMLGSQAATPMEIGQVSTWILQCGAPKN
jgi:hypothetical protein